MKPETPSMVSFAVGITWAGIIATLLIVVTGQLWSWNWLPVLGVIAGAVLLEKDGPRIRWFHRTVRSCLP